MSLLIQEIPVMADCLLIIFKMVQGHSDDNASDLYSYFGGAQRESQPRHNYPDYGFHGFSQYL
ncbi:hypothetical protein B7P43_G07434 [Cryptotermes secundus]|uniref:Uncharacterized protein n=1 Tax=Cryptotermes secundus TaxID=105785 RepID=A0A2J7R8E5_9NEOP|nr:hypothetical protein B7P43_G07434 [Cryptotermes secundus]